MGDSNYSDICWKAYSASHPQSRRFLQCTDDNFVMQMVDEPTRRGSLLDFVLTNKEGLVEAVMGITEGKPWLQQARDGRVQDLMWQEQNGKQSQPWTSERPTWAF